MSTVLSDPSMPDPTTAYYDDTVSQYLRRWCAGTGMCHFGYTNEYAHTHADTLRNTVRSVLGLAHLTDPTDHPLTILDAGCGLGGTAAYVAHLLDAHVTGITLSRDQYSYARRTYGFHRPQAPARGRATFAIDDMTDSRFPSATFDAVLAIESACHVSASRFLAEAHRLLKPGGVVVIADGIIREWNPDYAAAYDQWRSIWHVDQLGDRDAWHWAYDEAGFESIATADWTDAMTPSVHRLGHQARLARPMAKFLHRTHRMSNSQWANVQGAILWERLVQSGFCGYGAIVGWKPA